MLKAGFEEVKVECATVGEAKNLLIELPMKHSIASQCNSDDALNLLDLTVHSTSFSSYVVAQSYQVLLCTVSGSKRMGTTVICASTCKSTG